MDKAWGLLMSGDLEFWQLLNYRYAAPRVYYDYWIAADSYLELL